MIVHSGNLPWFPSRDTFVQGKRREDEENVLPLQHISRRY
jgi:hypothetical protein